MKVTQEMVDRFLAWKLPKDFCPDAGISFKPVDHPHALTHLWPIGTNLFTADQARAMLEHVLEPLPLTEREFLKRVHFYGLERFFSESERDQIGAALAKQGGV